MELTSGFAHFNESFMKNVFDIRTEINFNLAVTMNGYDMFGMCELPMLNHRLENTFGLRSKSQSDVQGFFATI